MVTIYCYCFTKTATFLNLQFRTYFGNIMELNQLTSKIARREMFPERVVLREPLQMSG